MKPIIWLLASLMLVLVVVGAGVFIWSGAYNIAADNPHWPLTEWLMDTARDRSIAAQASGVPAVRNAVDSGRAIPQRTDLRQIGVIANALASAGLSALG